MGGHPLQSPSHTENAVLAAEELADKSPVVAGNHLYFYNLQSVYIQLCISRLSFKTNIHGLKYSRTLYYASLNFTAVHPQSNSPGLISH